MRTNLFGQVDNHAVKFCPIIMFIAFVRIKIFMFGTNYLIYFASVLRKSDF